MAGSKQKVTIDGQEYPSRSHAAKALVASGKTLKETVKILADAGAQMTYQTVYAVTKGAEKVAVRRTKYRILNLGKSGRRTASEIAKKAGVTTSKVVSMLKKAGIPIVTKEAREKFENEIKAAKKAAKTKPAEKVEAPVPETPAPETENVPVDENQAEVTA